MKSLEKNSIQSHQNFPIPPKLQFTKKHLLGQASIPEYLNTKQVSDYLQVSTQWLEIGRVKGYGPPFIKLSRLVRYKKSDLDQWMKSHRQLNTAGL